MRASHQDILQFAIRTPRRSRSRSRSRGVSAAVSRSRSRSASRRRLRATLRKKSAGSRRKLRKYTSPFCAAAGKALRSCRLGKKSPVARASNWSFRAFGKRK